MTSTSVEVLALIPARGGSKSIPRKNLIEIAGRPLIAYSIEQALNTPSITRVVVSTDDEEIAEVSRDLGAEVPFLRPKELAGDTSPDIDTFRHALETLHGTEGWSPQLVVHLRPTGPVRRVGLIEDAIQRMLDNPAAESLRSVSLPIQTPYKMWRMEPDGYLKPLLSVPGFQDAHSAPRQLLPPVYWQNGYVDIIRPRTILEKRSMTGDFVLSFVVDEPIYEIDYPENIVAVADALERMRAGLPLHAVQTDSLQRHPV